MALRRASRDSDGSSTLRQDVRFCPPGSSESQENMAAYLATEFFRQVVANESAGVVEEARDHALAHGVAGRHMSCEMYLRYVL